MATDIVNNQGLLDTNQKLRLVTTRQGSISESDESYKLSELSISGIADQYDARFDDYNYYE